MAPIKTASADSTAPTSPQLLIPDEIALGEYLLLRISQANPKLKTIFGIPGDFNLKLLEYLYSNSVQEQRGIKFAGLCNELNAAYTADGYARAIGGLSVVITTFGVGELSAINGIAQAFSEYNPVLHIVGTTSLAYRLYARDSSNPVKNFHHLVQNQNPLAAPDHDVYKKMAEPVSVIQESLESNDEANLDKIDRVLIKIIQDSRPGYLYLPVDLADFKVSSERLFHPLNLEENGKSLAESEELLKTVANEILTKLYESSNPSFLSDSLMNRFNVLDQLNELISKLPRNFVKLFNTNMARNLDESRPDFVGVYQGLGSSSKGTADEFEKNTDLLIRFGHFNSETNTANYTANLSQIKTVIDVHHDYVQVNDKIYHIKNFDTGVRLFSLKDLMTRLVASVEPARLTGKQDNIRYTYQPQSEGERFKTLGMKYVTQSKMMDYCNNYLQPNDVLICETSAFLFGMPDIRLALGVSYIAGQFYGSIGYAVPGSLGVTFALNDLGSKRRIILLQSDGAAQMTIQELSTYIKYQDWLPNMPKVFLFNNDGYTIERWVGGPTRSFNDILGTWRWADLLKVLGDRDEEYHHSVVLRNNSEFDQYFASDHPQSAKLELIEMIMEKFDVPSKLDIQVGRTPLV